MDGPYTLIAALSNSGYMTLSEIRRYTDIYEIVATGNLPLSDWVSKLLAAVSDFVSPATTSPLLVNSEEYIALAEAADALARSVEHS
jgi:hypothetical protein